VFEEKARKESALTIITPQPWYARSRWLSAAELALGTFLVIGHNVYHIVPNEVPILFVLGLVSFRLREGSWTAIGLKLPSSWRGTILLALAAAGLRIVLGQFLIDPLTSHFWPAAIAPKASEAATHNLKVAFEYLFLVWTFAAFGEEISYRGYLLNRAADLGRRTKAAHWIAVFVSAVLFGYGHYYKGPAGIIDSGMAGLVLGTTYILSGRNLWACILAHGFIDTFGIVFLYMGWAT
jgi:CAAX protease family protein